MSGAGSHASHESQEAVHASHGSKHAALVIAVLAAALAITEQQAKRAEVQLTETAVLAVDAWNQYQAKSIRAAIAHDLENLSASLDQPVGPQLVAYRQQLLKDLAADQVHYETDPQDGKKALAVKAHAYEIERQSSLERSHSLDNAAAALDLGIVLATASVITASAPLLVFSYVMGLIGIVLGVAGIAAPNLLVF